MVGTESESGVVKWFDNEKGYGFITTDDGREIFVHYSAVRCELSKCSLEKGNRVTFIIINSPNGPQAQEVIVLN